MKASSSAWLYLLVLPLAFAVYYMATPSAALLAGDSPGYMYFSTDRPIGYPVFLFIIRHLTGGYEGVRYVQIFIFCLLTAILARALQKRTGSVAVALLGEFGVLVHPGPIGLANTIISDSLSASAILTFVVALMYFDAAPSLRRYALICTVTALAMSLRPVNIALVPATALVALLYRREPGLTVRKAGFLAATSVVMGFAVTPVANLLIHGSLDSSSPLARGLMQKAIFVDARAWPGRPRNPDADFIESLTNPVNDYLSTVPGDIRDIMRRSYSGALRFGSILPGLAMRHRLNSESQIDHIIMQYTLRRFAQDPASVVRQSAREYWNLLSNYTFLTSEQHARYLEFVRLHPPVIPAAGPMMEDEPMRRAVAEISHGVASAANATSAISSVTEPPKARPRVLIIALKFVQISSSCLSIILLWPLWLQLRGSSIRGTWIVLGLIALTAQLLLGITAVVEMAEPRYVYPVWPLLWIMLILVGSEAFAKWWSR